MIVIGCKKSISTQCFDSKIVIENRWHEENGGIDKLEVNNKSDILFICDRIKHFPNGKDVRVGYNHGYVNISLNDLKLDMIFTVNKGIVYRVDVGKYVHDEELTAKIIKIMGIKKRCWGEDCN